MKKIFVTLIAIFSILVMNVATLNAVAEEKPTIQKLLIIVDEEVSTYIAQHDNYENVEFVNVENFNDSFDNYVSYAISSFNATNDKINPILHNAFENYGAKIYLYGGLTISEYKAILSINDFYINMNALDVSGNISETVEMRFDKKQEEEKKEAIIALSRCSNSQSVTIAGDNLSQEDCIDVIIDHFTSTYVSPLSREITIVYSSFGHRVYSKRFSSAYLNVDYILYKETENDPTYDYYALKTNVVGTQTNPDTNVGVISFCNIEVKHKLIKANDNVTDYAPKDINRASNVSAGLSIGESGSTIGINFSSGSGPTIDSSYNPNTKEVHWKVSRYWFFGKTFSGDMFTFATSWATKSTVSIDVSTYGVFTAVGNYSFTVDWDTQRITFG